MIWGDTTTEPNKLCFYEGYVEPQLINGSGSILIPEVYGGCKNNIKGSHFPSSNQYSPSGNSCIKLTIARKRYISIVIDGRTRTNYPTGIMVALKTLFFTLTSVIAVKADWHISFTYADSGQIESHGLFKSGLRKLQ